MSVDQVKYLRLINAGLPAKAAAVLADAAEYDLTPSEDNTSPAAVAEIRAGIGSLGFRSLIPVNALAEGTIAAGVISGPALLGGEPGPVISGLFLTLWAMDLASDVTVSVRVIVAIPGDNTNVAIVDADLATIPAGSFEGAEYGVDFAEHTPDIVGSDLSVTNDTEISTDAGDIYSVLVQFLVKVALG